MIGFLFTDAVADRIKRGFDYLAARGAEPEPPRVPETLGGRARLNADFMNTVRELVHRDVFGAARLDAAGLRTLRAVYMLEVTPPPGDRLRHVTLREDGVICEGKFYGFCPSEATTMLYTQYLEKYPDAPVLMDLFQTQLEDLRALEEHLAHEKVVESELRRDWKQKRKNARQAPL